MGINQLYGGRIYDFQSEPFDRYVEKHSSNSRKPKDYMQLAHDMSPHSHPLVRYAAGCAAAEAALYRIPPSREISYCLDKRVNSLGFATRHWLTAADDLMGRYKAEQDEEKRAGYYAYSLRTLNALGNLPIMRLVTRLHGGDQSAAEEAPAAIDAVRAQQLALFRQQQCRTDLNEEEQTQRYRFFAELAGQTVLHDVFFQTGHLVIPTFIRVDHHPNTRLRPDFLATNIAPNHKRTPVQVSGTPKTAADFHPNIFTISGMDLRLRGQADIIPTLSAFDTLHQSGTLPTEIMDGLGGIGERMAERFNRHVHTAFRRPGY